MKFYALIIMPNMTLHRMWISVDEAVVVAKEHNCKIYQQSKDQEMIIQEDGSVLWKDVATVDKVG